MKPIDLSGLIKGLMVVIGISITLGKYPALEQWARNQMTEAVMARGECPSFFASQNQSGRAKTHTRGNLNGYLRGGHE